MAFGGVRLSILAALLAGGIGLALAAPAMDMVLLKDDTAVKWGPAPDSLPKGIKFSVLQGDPGQPGPFTLRLKIPAHLVIAPHTHATAENLTVLAGSLAHDMGETMEKARGKTLDAGGFVFLPANTPHTVWTEGQPAEIQVTGTGPFGLNYINPKDDPRNAGKP